MRDISFNKFYRKFNILSLILIVILKINYLVPLVKSTLEE